MGACDFFTVGEGKSLREAFNAAVDHAKWENGHGGYTGTIAEKGEVIETRAPAGVDPRHWAEWALYGEASREVEVPTPADWNPRKGFPPGACTSRGHPPTYFRREPVPPPAEHAVALARLNAKVRDKWGPAGAVALGDGKWLFFGMASS